MTDHIKALDPRLPVLMQKMCLHGANLNLKEYPGITGLEWAVMRGNRATIQKLLRLKSSRHLSEDTVKKAAILAQRLNRPDIAALLTNRLRQNNN